MKIKRFTRNELLFVSTIIFSVVVVYWRDLAILLDDAVGNEMANYILALPFLSAFMIYKKRSILKADLFFENEKKRETLLRDIVGISLSLSALFLYIYGSFSFNILEYHLISLILFVTGCAVFLLGIRNLVNLILPIGLLLLLLVPYREEAYQVSSQLSVLTSDITFRLLKTLGYPVSLSSLYESPAIVMQTLSGQEVPFVVDIPCAGAYSLIGFSVFAIFFAFISQGSVQKKATWLIIGFALIYSANIARIALTSVLGYWYNIEIAMELFHLLSGSVLIFIVSLLIIFLGEKILKIRVFKTVEDDVDNCPLCDENRTMGEDFCDFCGKFLNPIKNIITVSALGKILICSIFMAILINMQVSTFSLTTTNVMELDIQELTGNKEALGFLPLIEGYDELVFLSRDQGFEKFAQQDASLLYIYYSQNGTRAPIFVSIEIADSYSKLHRWEICLYIVPAEQGRQPVDSIVSRDIAIFENPPTTGRLFIFKNIQTGQTVAVLYWYEKLAFKIGGIWVNRYVKTSLIGFLDSFIATGEIERADDYGTIEKKMVSAAQTIINYWEPVKTWSTFNVAFAGWGQNLALMSIIGSCFFVGFLHFKEFQEEEKMARSSYKQLTWHSTFSQDEREVMKLLETLSRLGEATGIQIANAYKEENGKSVEPKNLIKMLKHLEAFNLVKKMLTKKGERTFIVYEANSMK